MSLNNVKFDIPTYELTLPSKKVIKYRPFTSKEEKNLLLSLNESNEHQLHTMKEVMNVCTFGALNLAELTVADVELIFISIRNKSLGETMDIVAECKCGASNSITLDLEKVKIVVPEKNPPEIKLTDKLWVIMKYPNIDAAFSIVAKREEDAVFELLAECMVTVIDGEENIDCSEESKENKIEFLEKLNHTQLAQIKAFLESAPRVTYDGKYKCVKCAETNNIHIEGLNNFFD